MSDINSSSDSEVAEYSSKSDFSKPALIAKAVDTCFIAGSKERREGYYNYTGTSENMAKTWMPDGRKEFCESVGRLKSLLTPEILKFPEIIDKIKKIEIKKQGVFDKYAITYPDGIKRIPKVGDTRYTKKLIVGNGLSSQANWVTDADVGHWDQKNSFYWDDLVLIYDELFELLNQLIDSLNYFKSGAGF